MLEPLYLVILVGTVLVLVAALSSLLAFRFGAPLLLLFLSVGLLAGTDGLGIQFDNAGLAYFVGSIALAIILFDSGFRTPLQAFRNAAAPALALATVGVLVTAGLFGAAASWLLGIPLLDGLLLGAIVGSTDAAAVFFLLRIGGITIRERVRSTLEIESGSNDPMAIFLTIVLVELIVEGAGLSELGLNVLLGFLRQMGLGLVLGLAGGWMIRILVNKLDVEAGLLPILTLALAMLVFAVTGVVDGSGFLAVYVAGLYAGNSGIRLAASLRRFQDGMTWLAQIIMFLMLGLLVTPSQFLGIGWQALALSAFLIFVARPLAVSLSLLPFSFQQRERAFVSWVGLRGAVSILLAIVPLIAGIDPDRTFFNVAFIVVLVSLLVQGWTINLVAARLGLVVPQRIGPVERVELELPGTATHELVSWRVVEGSPVARGERVPRWARPSLVVRDGQSMRYQYAGRLRAGDTVYLFISPRLPRLLDRLFASPVAVRPDDAEFFGEFSVDPSQPAADLAAAYGATLREGERDMTISQMMIARLGGRAEYGDRVLVKPVELIVRETDIDGEVIDAGLSLEPEGDHRRIPIVFDASDVATVVRGVFSPLRKALGLRQTPKGETKAGRAPAQEPQSFDDAEPPARIGETGTMTEFKTLDDVDLSGKRVLVRVDLNVPMKDGQVTDGTRIERILPTIREIADKGGRVILLAHFGRPKGKPDPAQSLEPLAGVLSKALGKPVGFSADCAGPVAAGIVSALKDGDVVLLENTRFHAGEEKNDDAFAAELASLGDLYVNDAFSAAHRAHASTEGLARHLPSYAGRTMQAELEALEKGLGRPQKPVLAIVGGAKVSTKIDLLQNLVARVDGLVIGGGMANTFLAAQGVDVGKSLCEHDLADTARAILEAAKTAGCEIVLPVDAVVAREFKAGAANEMVDVGAVPADAMILDVGPKSVEAVAAWIDRAKTLVWNGPMGAFEIEPFDRATVAAARHAAERTRSGTLVSVAGGGDTVAALNHAGAADGFTYVSTAGGAFLEWMEGKALPGVEVLKA